MIEEEVLNKSLEHIYNRAFVLEKHLSGSLLENEATQILREIEALKLSIQKNNCENDCFWQFQLFGGDWVLYPKKMSSAAAAALWHSTSEFVRAKKASVLK